MHCHRWRQHRDPQEVGGTTLIAAMGRGLRSLAPFFSVRLPTHTAPTSGGRLATAASRCAKTPARINAPPSNGGGARRSPSSCSGVRQQIRCGTVNRRESTADLTAVRQWRTARVYATGPPFANSAAARWSSSKLQSSPGDCRRSFLIRSIAPSNQCSPSILTQGPSFQAAGVCERCAGQRVDTASGGIPVNDRVIC